MTNTMHIQRGPFSLLLLLVLLSMGSYLLAPILFMAIGVEILDTTIQEFMRAIGMSDPNPGVQLTLLAIQACTAILSFIVLPAVFIRHTEDRFLGYYFHAKGLLPLALMITFGLTLCLMVANSVLIEWNMNINFPESLASTFDRLEEQGRVMTEYITSFYSFPYFILVFCVVAVVPAIGEEFLFRGLIQSYFQRIWSNPHVAIWLTAIFFSAFHLQFYGFVPRMVLGAFFGYLYYYSGNLWYASLAHFINNGFTLIMIYLFQQDLVKFDIENETSVGLWSAGIFMMIGGILFVLFRKQFHITDILQNE